MSNTSKFKFAEGIQILLQALSSVIASLLHVRNTDSSVLGVSLPSPLRIMFTENLK